MESTNISREAIISGIESLTSRVKSLAVLRSVWKLLYREYNSQGGLAVSSMQNRNALRYYARHLNEMEIEAVLRYIHTITKV